MKKLLNDPNQAAAELIDGLVDYYNGSVTKVGPGANCPHRNRIWQSRSPCRRRHWARAHLPRPHWAWNG